MYQNLYIERDRETGDIVHLWDDEKGYVRLPYKEFDYAYVPDPLKQSTITSLYGVPVRKVKTWRKDDAFVIEKDVPAETRVLTDLYLDDDMPSKNHRILLFDIEVSMREGIPDPNKGENRIYSIACWDSVENKYIVFVLQNEKEQAKNVEKESVRVLVFDTEKQLLKAFLEYYTSVSPTIISGWNSDYFDVPYLYNRLEVVLGHQHATSLSPIGIVRYNKTRERFGIAGVSSLDYMQLYKKFTYSEKSSYRLDSIGEAEVGVKKVAYTGTLDELYENELDKFVQYNIQDVRILVLLNEKLKFIELVRGICHVGHVPYEDYSYSSRFLEGTLICYLHRKNIIVPNKADDAREQMQEMDESGEKGFAGAYVQEPQSGLHEWVYSLDLQSLYPSIIMSLNISPETKVGHIKNWDLEEYVKGIDRPYDVVYHRNASHIATRDSLVEFLQSNKLMVSSNGILYTSEKRGVIPEVLEHWFAQRVEFKNLMKKYEKEGNAEMRDFYDRRQHIQKIFLNSAYGVLGLPIFRFYDLDNALAVTATGQDVIKTSAKYVNRSYSKITGDSTDYCIYIDTDSLYFSSEPVMRSTVNATAYRELDVPEVDQTIQLARHYESELNKFYDVVAKKMFNCEKHRFVIKGESICKTAFWVTKKRYALLKVYDLETNTAKEKLTIKGLDVVRSNFAPVFKNHMSEILMDILKKTPKSEIDKKVLDFKAGLSKRPIIDIAKPTSVKDLGKWHVSKHDTLTDFQLGTPVHVKSAMAHNRLLKQWKIQNKYEPLRDGSKIKWVYLKENPYKLDSVAFTGYNDPPQLTKFIADFIDYDKMFESDMKNKLTDFYDAMKWGIIPTEVNQKAFELFDFS